MESAISWISSNGIDCFGREVVVGGAGQRGWFCCNRCDIAMLTFEIAAVVDLYSGLGCKCECGGRVGVLYDTSAVKAGVADSLDENRGVRRLR